MATTLIVFKHCVDSLSSRGKNSSSRNDDNVDHSDSNADNCADALKYYKLFEEPKSTEIVFPKIYDFPKKESEPYSTFGLLKSFDNNTNEFMSDYLNRVSGKTKPQSYDWFTGMQKVLDDLERERSGIQQNTIFHSEETQRKPKKEKKQRKPKYPYYYE